MNIFKIIMLCLTTLCLCSGLLGVFQGVLMADFGAFIFGGFFALLGGFCTYDVLTDGERKRKEQFGE